MAIKLFAHKRSDQGLAPSRPPRETVAASEQPTDPDYDAAPLEQLDDDPLKQLFQQGRHSAIVHEETKWNAHPGGARVVEKAKAELEARMALVPAGTVSISQTLTAQPDAPEEEVEVRPFLLDVHAVTNARYQKFVDADGYDALEFWPEEIWPHLIELKDLTGEPGPRYWRHGRHNTRLSDHPIVGVSWYEAQAFALWIGQRLPSEAEWQMAACWHINSSSDLLRRFPWGDAMDNARCNVWSSRKGRAVRVTEYRKGAAPNHVLQLVGNTWEWTDTEYSVNDDEGKPVFGEMPMHVIRGGAFDTYFETQATSHFRTGQIALSRTHNVGFRCAMNLDQASWINGS